MAINGTIKMTRPNTSTAWYVVPDETKAYLKENFMAPIFQKISAEHILCSRNFNRGNEKSS